MSEVGRLEAPFQYRGLINLTFALFVLGPSSYKSLVAIEVSVTFTLSVVTSLFVIWEVVHQYIWTTIILPPLEK